MSEWEISILVAGTEDGPIKGVKKVCHDCGVDVYPTPSSLRAAGPGALVVCWTCGGKRVNAEGAEVRIEPLTREQRDELDEYLALDFGNKDMVL